MKQNEIMIQYPWPTEGNGYHIHVYDSLVEFVHRDFFEHRHADFEISCVLNGKGVYRLRDGTVSLQAGDVFVFGSNQIHCITDSDPSDPIRIFNIQFEPRMLWSPAIGLSRCAYLQLFNGKCERMEQKNEITRTISSKIRDLREESTQKRAGYDVMVRAYLDEILTLLMRNTPSFETVAGQSNRSKSLYGLDRSMDYINSHLNVPMSLDEIAKQCGLSRTYFSSLFSFFNGLTPWEYITLRRIERSCTLLKDTDLSVLEVAGQCGYVNLSNFNRMFIRTIGMSPSAFRRKWKKTQIS